MSKSFLREARVAVRSQAFNLDNGNGTTVDEAMVVSHTSGIRLIRVYALYNEATQTVAGGSFQVGTTAGGTDLVAATNYENTKAVGTYTNAAIALDAVAPNTTIFVRHTGVAATQTGTAVIVIEFAYDE